ncbi:MAG: LysR family transcriptional regulator [Verrucomicrobiota bacterium]
MEIHRVKYFLEVARWSSFSKAAQVCHISQPSLSQQIKKLEDEVGGQLILRSRDGTRLSELGGRFLPYARSIIDSVDSARSFIDESSQRVTGRVKIGGIPTIAPYLMPHMIQHVRSSFPDIQYELVEDTTDVLISKLRQGDIDFALISPPTKIDQDVDYITLSEDELLLTLPLDHPLNKESKFSVNELKNEKLLLLKEAHCLSEQSKVFCRSSNLAPEISFKSTQIDTLIGLVELGLGFTFTPKMAVSRHSGRRVKFHSVSPDPYIREVRLVWMNRHIPSTTQLAFLDCTKTFNFVP